MFNKILLLVITVITLSASNDIVKKANEKYAMGNFKKAAKYLPKACQTGDAKSCYYAGYLYSNGIGTIQNINKAIAFYKKACKSKYKKSCHYVKKYSKKDNGLIKMFTTKYDTEFKR